MMAQRGNANRGHEQLPLLDQWVLRRLVLVEPCVGELGETFVAD
jgi:hypothetical protein